MSSQTNTIEWKHLKCSVSREFVGGRAVRTVLNRVSGRSCAQLTAVIGPSGCGKSLLLNCLSGRLPRSRSTEFTGSILVNGTSASSGELALCSRYDNVLPYLSVWETLCFAALFTLSYKEARQATREAIYALGLGRIQDSMVSCVSTGEARQISIAAAVVTKPPFLFLDEPTRGIDAHASQCVLEMLRGLAHRGTVVICAVHQPRSSMFPLVDNLIVLSEGMTVYCAPPTAALTYLSSLGFLCPDRLSPFEFLIDLVAVDYTDTATSAVAAKAQGRVAQLASSWVLHCRRTEHATTLTSPTGVCVTPGNACIFRGLGVLMMRWGKGVGRGEGGLKIRATMLLFVAIMGSLLAGGGDAAWYSHSNLLIPGMLFLLVFGQCMLAGLSTILDSSVKHRVAHEEMRTGIYPTFTFVVATLLCESTEAISLIALLSSIVYWWLGLGRPYAIDFLVFLGVSCLNTMSGVALGLLVRSFCWYSSRKEACTTFLAILSLMVVVSGYPIHLHKVPEISHWISFISVIRWGFQAFMTNSFQRSTSNADAELILEVYSFQEYSTAQASTALAVLVVVISTLSAMLLHHITRINYTPVSADNGDDDVVLHLFSSESARRLMGSNAVHVPSSTPQPVPQVATEDNI